MSEQSNIINNIKERVQFRTALRAGHLNMPTSVTKLLHITPLMREMWEAIWNNFITNKAATPTTFWMDKFPSNGEFNVFIKHLCDTGWLTSNVYPNRNWAELNLNEDKLIEAVGVKRISDIMTDAKFNKYVLPTRYEATSGSRTKLNGRIQDTGLVRNGFEKSGETEFKYDQQVLTKYEEAIKLNVGKSMTKVRELYPKEIEAYDYESVSDQIVDYHINVDISHVMGRSLNDSRGRAISTGLSKVFNPIQYTDARALMVIPYGKLVTVAKLRKYTKNMYLAIAELLGCKRSKSEANKAKIGRAHYQAKHLPILDLTSEDDREELHKLIWLERIYAELDLFFARDRKVAFRTFVPIEKDASASILMIQGLLLNHRPYMEATNCLTQSGLTDPWDISGLPRSTVKAAATPILYGSSQAPDVLWRGSDIKFTTKQLGVMQHHLTTGFFSVANGFKELLVNNVQPTNTMNVTVWNDVNYRIECNRFKMVGEYTKRYPIYCSETKLIQPISHTHTHKVPDLTQFVRFFPTNLIHGIDGQVADTICEAFDWIISIHDAFIVSAVDGDAVSELYASLMEDIHANRDTILNNFFKSINLHPKAIAEWNDLLNLIEPHTGTFKCNRMALK